MWKYTKNNNQGSTPIGGACTLSVLSLPAGQERTHANIERRSNITARLAYNSGHVEAALIFSLTKLIQRASPHPRSSWKDKIVIADHLRKMQYALYTMLSATSSAHKYFAWYPFRYSSILFPTLFVHNIIKQTEKVTQFVEETMNEKGFPNCESVSPKNLEYTVCQYFRYSAITNHDDVLFDVASTENHPEGVEWVHDGYFLSLILTFLLETGI